MDFQEIKKEARYKVESLMGLFDYLEEEFGRIEQQRKSEKEKMIIMENLLISVRRVLREKAEYELADRIREGLKKVGVTVEDANNKTRISRNP